MCDDEKLNINTYKKWEIGRVGLPKDGAQIVIDRMRKGGVISSLSWLLYGEEEPPYVILLSPNFCLARKHVAATVVSSGAIPYSALGRPEGSVDQLLEHCAGDT